MKLFKRGEIILLADEDTNVPEYTEREREDFHDGYCQGFPLVGQPQSEIPAYPSREYLRGFMWGRHDHVPGVPYEE